MAKHRVEDDGMRFSPPVTLTFVVPARDVALYTALHEWLNLTHGEGFPRGLLARLDALCTEIDGMRIYVEMIKKRAAQRREEV